jgi:hypothetical protein
MKARSFSSIAGLLLVFVSGCLSSNPKMQSAESQRPVPITAQQVFSTNSIWSIPPDLPTFGIPTTNCIHVLVFGRSIKKRGYYYLPRGTNVLLRHPETETRWLS